MFTILFVFTMYVNGKPIPTKEYIGDFPTIDVCNIALNEIRKDPAISKNMQCIYRTKEES